MGVYICPVCSGKGFVDGGFYQLVAKGDYYPSNTADPTTICRSCCGKGVIFDHESFNTNITCNEVTTQTFQLKGTCSNCWHAIRSFVLESGEFRYRCSKDLDYHDSDYRCEKWDLRTCLE